MKKILSGHGSGGKLMHDLIDRTIRERLGGAAVQLDDAAILAPGADRIAFTTDSYTVTPIFFPGGDIGSLAVNGTVNDLAVMGAEPRWLSCGLILEEGLSFDELERVLDSMGAAAGSAGVQIVTGDTKVVPAGKGDKVFINTSGIGLIRTAPARRPVTAGDVIIVSGTIGDHGMTIMALRNDLSLGGDLKSDCAALNGLIAAAEAAAPGAIKFMRDPTRGGVASVINEIVAGTPLSAKLLEERVPVRDQVRGVAGMLGIDPLYVANEGKVVIVAAAGAAEAIVAAMRAHEFGRDAAIIGELDREFPGKAYIETLIGGRRILPLLVEDQLPRIC